jgi:hypothetical protein
MFKWLYIYIVKRRLEFLDKHYKESYVRFGPEHRHTIFFKKRWYDAGTKAIQTLEEWDV